MLVSSVTPQTLPSNSATAISVTSNLLLLTCKSHSIKPSSTSSKPPSLAHSSSLSVSRDTTSLANPRPSDALFHHAVDTAADDDRDGSSLQPSAYAVVSTIRKASNSPVEFVQRIEHDQRSRLVLPSSDFQRLCMEQFDLFRRIVDSDALLSVYVRPAGSYVMDRLELRRVSSYPESGQNATEVITLVGNFNIPTGLRAAEAALSNQQAEEVAECRAVVFPMVKHPFVVGFLVAELPRREGRDLFSNPPSPGEAYSLPPSRRDMKLRRPDLPSFGGEEMRMFLLTADQKSNAINISRSLAMAYVMDQKAMLLQQSSWQNNVRMNNLVEQIRGPLSSIWTLTKMLSLHTKQSEIAYDIAEDILVQGDRIRDTLEQLQEAVHLTKANIMRYNEESLKKMHDSTKERSGSVMSQFSDTFPRETPKGGAVSPDSAVKDLELPMPPLALAPLQQHGIRPCFVSDVLSDLVGALSPLAQKQQRVVELRDLSQSLAVAVEEAALRQALNNLIEGALLRTNVGGRIDIVSTGAPTGGAVVVIDDDGPDMHYMTQMHLLTPFGPDLCSGSGKMVEDNMTWNFVAGLTVAREILEGYGCVVRVISPRTQDNALGTGGTRIELWLPAFDPLSDSDQEPSAMP